MGHSKRVRGLFINVFMRWGSDFKNKIKDRVSFAKIARSGGFFSETREREGVLG